ncbi:MAG TPA: ketoacyl-ACP synthase III [Gemmataceae bacterium]|nr:ketoacyl-ACP synthase III [Gemmataceae bacterium]
MFAAIRAIEYHLPEGMLTNDELACAFPGWTPEKIAAKTGIVQRRITAPQECASDLAVVAARKLFAGGTCRPEEIDFILLCTQSPDYFLPTTACILQDRLGLPTSAGALDYNLGCSGFVYGLSLAKGLIETGQAANVLLLTAETYSKFLHPDDRSVRPLFGDAAAATLVQARPDAPDGDLPWIGPFVFGTDGKGMENLIVRAGGMRQPTNDALPHGRGSVPSAGHLFMNGPEIFTFALRAVPQAVQALLDRAERTIDDIDLFVFHQANRYMLEHLRDKLKIPPEKFVVAMSHVGNTVSSTIPIALKDAVDRQLLQVSKLVLLVGFGVGYSWAATLIRSSL